ncbi:MAG: hypothetical protein HQK50_14800 [Oligoflexia bacterium]|nr:hypothetical protein [Oligoflexia bacterium]
MAAILIFNIGVNHNSNLQVQGSQLESVDADVDADVDIDDGEYYAKNSGMEQDANARFIGGIDGQLGSLHSVGSKVFDSYMKDLERKQLEKIERAEQIEEEIFLAKKMRMEKIKNNLQQEQINLNQGVAEKVQEKETKKKKQRKISSEK